MHTNMYCNNNDIYSVIFCNRFYKCVTFILLPHYETLEALISINRDRSYFRSNKSYSFFSLLHCSFTFSLLLSFPFHTHCQGRYDKRKTYKCHSPS